VRLDEPSWWYGEADDPRRRVLAPVAALYGWAAERRYKRQRAYRSRLPVICVGNFVAGGTGKTPLSLLISRLLHDRGGRPAFLSRGYGGHETGPVWVEPVGGEPARRFGDEPLLLARSAPTMVARDRRAGVIAIETDPREFTAVIMDDGLQNGAVTKDLTLALVDGVRGLGNGEVIPAGPMRAPLDFQLGIVDVIVVRDPPAENGVHDALRRSFPGPVLAAKVQPQGSISWLPGKSLIAFAGIANPQRFYSLLESLGANVIDKHSFPDHHSFTAADAKRLVAAANAAGAELITTDKDFVRISGNATFGELIAQTHTLPIELTFEPRDADRLGSLLEAALSAPGRRHVPPIR